jgi:hypothetical protein
VGFIADPAWIITYPGMLLNYQSEGNVSACSECASLPVWLSRWFFDGSLATAIWIALGLLSIFVLAFYFIRSFMKSHDLLLSTALLITLLVSPYLYNYDFLLLLVPFAVLLGKGTLVQRVIIGFCYLVPTFALLLYGRNGNISLSIVSMVVMLLLYICAKNLVIDGTGRGA